MCLSCKNYTFTQFLLRAHHAPRTVPGTGYTMMNETYKGPALAEPTF